METLKRIRIPIFLLNCLLYSAEPLILNAESRAALSLDGKWQMIIDPYELGYYNYRYEPDPNGWFRNASPQNRWDLIEYSFDNSRLLHVPGDWNTQKDELFYYEGTVWYKKDFNYSWKSGRRLFIYFGAANYDVKVYLNGTFVGDHTGGFTPFNFEVTGLVKPEGNFIVAKVDNKRLREGIPTVNTDWWNYGGLTRSVMLLDLPVVFIRDYFIQLAKDSRERIEGWVQLSDKLIQGPVTLSIPELNIHRTVKTDSLGRASFNIKTAPLLWSPENPKLYEVHISSEEETISDRIGFRSLETDGYDILLNGRPIFLRGICIHEQAPLGGRACTREHAQTLLGWAKDLNCNFVRLAHYPHNAHMTRVADEMGLMVWAEIPVYWTILWDNPATYRNAENQLTEMITRDKNRASVILWSMANETPQAEGRLEFISNLAEHARSLDPTRLLTAAMERRYIDSGTQMIDDPLGNVLDVSGCNEYIGWYDGLPSKCDTLEWQMKVQKPLIISELGGSALQGLHGDTLTRWTEEFQENLYQHQIRMLERIPFLRGVTPWILMDFRSPRRPLTGIQDGWNRKGLISDSGQKKKAFWVLKRWYEEIEHKNP